MAGDVRGVHRRAARWRVTSVPTGQAGKPAASVSTGSGAQPAAGLPPAAAGQSAATRRQTAGWPRYVPAVIAAAVMAALGLWGLTRSSSMGNDEVATRWAALLGLRQLAHLLRHVDAVHGLYYLLMHGWVVLGSSPTVLRIPSVLAMTAAAALVVILARRLTGSGWAALFAGLVMALTPVISFYAQTARSYALVYACVVASTLALVHALDIEHAGRGDRPLVRAWLGYGLLILVGGYLNEMSLLVLTAHAVTVLLARYGRAAVRHWLVTSGVAALLVVPLAVISAKEDGAVAWIPRPNLGDLQILAHDYLGAGIAVPVLIFCCIVAALLPPVAGRRRATTPASDEQEPDVAWWRRPGISLPSVATPLVVLPAALLLLESVVARPLYTDRYVLYGEVGVALLAGAGAYRIGQWLAGAASQRSLIWVPGAVLCVCALVLQLGAQQRARTPQSRLYDFGGPSRYVAAHARQGDGVLFFNDFFRKARLGYPDDFRKVSDFAMAVPPTQAGTFRGINKPVAAIQPLMLGYQRIWVVGWSPERHLRAGPIEAQAVVLRSRFSLAARHYFRNIWVTLWVRR
jgi:mannosyltransferase